VNTTPIFHACLAACTAIALAFLPTAHADDHPRIDALRVAKIATDYLATHGKGAPDIVSIAIEKDALFHGKTSWVVRWSHPLAVDGNMEVGMRVKFDGTVSYLVDEKAGSKKRAEAPKS